MKLILSSTLHPTNTTGQGFGMHEGAPPFHDPQATMGAGGVWQLPLSNQLFDYHCYHHKCLFVRITVPFVISAPITQDPTSAPLGPPALAPGLPQQGWSPAPHSPAQPSPALHIHGGPQPILGSYFQRLLMPRPGAVLSCLPQVSVSQGDCHPQSSESSHSCSALPRMSLSVYLTACIRSWDYPLLLFKYFKSISFSLIFKCACGNLNLCFPFPTVYYKNSFCLLPQGRKMLKRKLAFLFLRKEGP